MERGDTVVATARNIAALQDLKDKRDHILPLQLDVNNRLEVFEVTEQVENISEELMF